ncbi:MAG: hypothetical protein ACI85O_003684, partial [Saprospiraceae bacterium]
VEEDGGFGGFHIFSISGEGNFFWKTIMCGDSELSQLLNLLLLCIFLLFGD